MQLLYSLLGLDIQLFYWLIGVSILYLILRLHLNSMKDQVLIEGQDKGYRYRIIQKESIIRKIMDIIYVLAFIMIVRYFVGNRAPIYIFKV